MVNDDATVAGTRSADTNSNPISGRIQGFGAVFGASLAAAGAVAVFVTSNSAGAGSLVAFGAVVALFSMFANRIQSFEGGGLKINMAAAATLVALADEAERAGHTDTAEELRIRAVQQLSAAGLAANRYEAIRRSQGAGWQRTALLEKVTSSCAKLLLDEFRDKASVESLYGRNGDGDRITAISIIELEPKLGSTHVVTDAVRHSRSAFEQWHALHAMQRMLDVGAADVDREAFRHSVETAMRERRFGTDRALLASTILAQL